MRIAIASDHNGTDLRTHLRHFLSGLGHEVDDRGVDGDEAVDYPPIVADVAYQVLDGSADRGIIVGGTGSGEHIAANKIAGIRAAYCHELLTARISRENNDTNMLVMGSMVIGWRVAQEITRIWVETDFTYGRHVPRLEQIAALERGERLQR
jgi:ribose 5-phosphate isomerase B